MAALIIVKILGLKNDHAPKTWSPLKDEMQALRKEIKETVGKPGVNDVEVFFPLDYFGQDQAPDFVLVQVEVCSSVEKTRGASSIQNIPAIVKKHLPEKKIAFTCSGCRDRSYLSPS